MDTNGSKAKNEPSKNANEVGPQAFSNWQRALRELPAHSWDEIPLYSDAHMTHEITQGWGPYQALNTISSPYQSGCAPVLILRAVYHQSPNVSLFPNLECTDTSNYHGGGIAEEISALIGLALGIRLRPGGVTRQAYPDSSGVLRERPLAQHPASVPTLMLDPREPPVIPGLGKTVRLEASILAEYPNLPPMSAVALVRAARLFQHGLWLCESNSNDAWLMFVSAAEVASVLWRSSETDDDQEKLFRELKPEWATRLDKTGDPTLVRDMAEKWTDLLGATNRFLKFLLAHLPDAPPVRPPFGIVEWTHRAMKKALGHVYAYRSTSLHSGIPFPVPMCSPPYPLGNNAETFSERPLGTATASVGGVWTYDDTPMHLHIFAYIVRGALIKWWDCMKREVERGIAPPIA